MSQYSEWEPYSLLLGEEAWPLQELSPHRVRSLDTAQHYHVAWQAPWPKHSTTLLETEQQAHAWRDIPIFEQLQAVGISQQWLEMSVKL